MCLAPHDKFQPCLDPGSRASEICYAAEIPLFFPVFLGHRDSQQTFSSDPCNQKYSTRRSKLPAM